MMVMQEVSIYLCENNDFADMVTAWPSARLNAMRLLNNTLKELQ